MDENQSQKIADRDPGLKSFLDGRHQSAHLGEQDRHTEIEGDDCQGREIDLCCDNSFHFALNSHRVGKERHGLKRAVSLIQDVR
jgi:hypothetical protein